MSDIKTCLAVVCLTARQYSNAEQRVRVQHVLESQAKENGCIVQVYTPSPDPEDNIISEQALQACYRDAMLGGEIDDLWVCGPRVLAEEFLTHMIIMAEAMAEWKNCSLKDSVLEQWLENTIRPLIEEEGGVFKHTRSHTTKINEVFD